MELTNRAVMAPMVTNLVQDERPTDAYLAYIKRRAEAGVGLIITEVAAVHPLGSFSNREIGIHDDKFIPALKRVVDTVHAGGSKVALQLHHSGRENIKLLSEGKAVGPSAKPSLLYEMTPKEMSSEMIQETITAFGQAAVRAREAGFDAVEILGGHGYLLAQFLSAIVNDRQDEYGGGFQDRARFMIRVLQSVRKAVGDDYPILLRLSAEECIANGYTVEDIQQIAPDLVKAGADAIHASLGTQGGTGWPTIAPAEYEPGFNVWRARKIKEVVKVPVIAVGRITEPELADKVISRGDADLVSFGRQFLADPDFLLKAREGRSAYIRKCVACNQGCIERVFFTPDPIRCAINPETGQELAYPIAPSKTARVVWVIGAGPAGLTAAYEAARLGHKVTLFEKEDRAGGNLFYTSRTPFKEGYGKWMEWLIGQVKKIGVDLRTSTFIDDAFIKQADCDVVILATGGERVFPKIKGIDRPIVCDPWHILNGTRTPGENVVVVGAGLIGMETADFIAEQGSHVTLIEQLKKSPIKSYTAHGYMLHERLGQRGCRLLLDTRLESIQKDAVTVVSNNNKKTITGIDQVVIAVGMKPRDHLRKILEEKGIRHYVVGDASKVQRIFEATQEGARAAWVI